jgi:Mn2+/Fe2+ NRAMP family transporter
MTATIWKTLAALCAVAFLSNCAPLIGAAAVVGADEVAEQDGDQGLFCGGGAGFAPPY